jgi:hypothetical protein
MRSEMHTGLYTGGASYEMTADNKGDIVARSTAMLQTMMRFD